MALRHPAPPSDLHGYADVQLIELARGCDRGAAAELETAKRCIAVVYERHRGLVRAMCARSLPPGAVDDVESDVYVRFVQTVYGARAAMTNPAGLLVTMASRVVADHWRSGARQPEPAGALPEVATDGGLDEAAAVDAFESMLRPLNGSQQDVLRRRFLDDLSAAEIGEAVGKEPGNVAVVVHRALKQLRKDGVR